MADHSLFLGKRTMLQLSKVKKVEEKDEQDKEEDEKESEEKNKKKPPLPNLTITFTTNKHQMNELLLISLASGERRSR